MDLGGSKLGFGASEHSTADVNRRDQAWGGQYVLREHPWHISPDEPSGTMFRCWKLSILKNTIWEVRTDALNILDTVMGAIPSVLW